MIKRGVSAVLVVGLLSLHVAFALANEEKRCYKLGVAASRRGDTDAAFMYFREVVRGSVNSPYYDEALFATGEYYFLHHILHEASAAFSRFLELYPDNPNRIFALAYLLKIAQEKNEPYLAARVRHQIVTMQQVSLLFRDSKQYEYTSCLTRNLKVIYYIDKVEFYANGELFTTIPY